MKQGRVKGIKEGKLVTIENRFGPIIGRIDNVRAGGRIFDVKYHPKGDSKVWYYILDIHPRHIIKFGK